MGTVWIRIPHALDNSEVAFVVEPPKSGQAGMKPQFVGDFERVFNGQSRTRTEIRVVAEWHERIQSVISARQLENDQDRGVLSRRCHRVRSHRVEGKKGSFQKNRDRPGESAAENRGSEKLSAGVNGLVHVSW